MNEIEVDVNSGISSLRPVFASTYSIRVNNDVISSNLEIESGGVYAIIINKDNNVYVSYY